VARPFIPTTRYAQREANFGVAESHRLSSSPMQPRTPPRSRWWRPQQTEKPTRSDVSLHTQSPDLFNETCYNFLESVQPPTEGKTPQFKQLNLPKQVSDCHHFFAFQVEIQSFLPRYTSFLWVWGGKTTDVGQHTDLSSLLDAHSMHSISPPPPSLVPIDYSVYIHIFTSSFFFPTMSYNRMLQLNI
jgi:hypothetical protein